MASTFSTWKNTRELKQMITIAKNGSYGTYFSNLLKELYLKCKVLFVCTGKSIASKNVTVIVTQKPECLNSKARFFNDTVIMCKNYGILRPYSPQNILIFVG